MDIAHDMAPPPSAPAPGDRRWFLRAPVLSWALYDLANTIFSMNIVSFFFSLWVVNTMGATDSAFAYAASISYAVIFVASPFLGALTDQAPRRMPFLVASTLICVAFTLFLGRGGLLPSLIFFGAANVAYQAGLQFYDALLPEVSAPENRGRVGGFGIGLGYLGSFIGLFLGGLLVAGVEELPTAEQTERYRLVFVMTGGLFLLFALPCFVFVKERVRRAKGYSVEAVAAAGRQVVETFRSARRHPDLFRFLIGRVFYTDAVNTVIAFMGIYVTNEVGFTAGQAQTVLLVAISFAVLGGFVWGKVVDQVGPKRSLDWVLYLWGVVFVWTAVVGFAGLPGAVFWPVPILAGLALGGTWSADRPYMLLLTPPEKVGEYYGLYGMVGRFSAITGPFVWALVVDVLGLGRPAAITTLLLGIVVAWVILRPLPDRTEKGAPQDAPLPPPMA